MYYAKSEPRETILEHTKALLDNLKVLERTYGKEILENKNINKDRFWYLLEIICTYHDVGKVYTPFQNLIRKELKKEQISTKFNYENIKHEMLSPLFVPVEKLGLTKEEKVLVYQAIFYHHERNYQNIDSGLITEIIDIDIIPIIDDIKNELRIDIKENLNNFYLKYVTKRIVEGNELYEQYCLLKGLLHRLDHSSSGHLQIEDQTKENIGIYTKKYLKDQGYNLNELQEFCILHWDKNLVIIAPTGMGKTEAALLWSNGSKSFFTLPIRTSIDAIFDRIRKEIGYKPVGLLHSSALEHLEKMQEIVNEEKTYEESKNLAMKFTTLTIDQIFTFVFKYRGYEKMYSTLSYSKVIIDEIQAYSPEIVAVILKGLEMINKLGGKFMIMTATLPRIYKEKLEEMGVEFEFKKFNSDKQRHKIKLINNEMIEHINKIYKNGKDNKVLVIANTINKAIEIYKVLKIKENINVNLLHSRFIGEDRSKKEKKIKDFSKNKNEKGIWITTQIVEASLDIDFDYLYTEMSTLDSLFQRLGRCYRNRDYSKDEPNVYVYTKETSGIGSIYDKEISDKSIEMLKQYDNSILKEDVKVELVDKLYSKEVLEGTNFYKKYNDGMKILDNIIDYNTNKKEAQQLLRNIDNITVIPNKIYDKNSKLFELYSLANKNKNWEERNKKRREINKLTVSISKNQKYIQRDNLYKCKEIDDLYIAYLKYNEDIGLLLEKDEEYELNDRFSE